MRSIFKQLTVIAAVGALATAPAWSQGVVRIGFSGPLSGGAALYGRNCLDGMNMAAAEINAVGLEVAGTTYKVEIVALDDHDNPAETAINARRLRQESKTPAILVTHSGGILALQATNEAQKYLILAYSSTPQIVSRGNSLTLRIPPDFSGYIDPFNRYAMAKFGKKLAIAGGDDEYAKAWSTAFKPAWEAVGGKVVADGPMSYIRATDFSSSISKVIASKPDVLSIGGPSEPTGLVVKQARELGFRGGFIILDQAKMDEVSKVSGGLASLEGSIGVLPLVDDRSPETKAFVQRYRKIHATRDPSSEVSLNYTAVHATVTAMRFAGTVTDAVAIRAQLDKAFKTLPARYNPAAVDGVDERGGSIIEPRVAVVEGGQIRELKLRSEK